MFIRLMAFFLCVAIFHGQLMAQTNNITGRVTSGSDGKPISGVTVKVAGTTISTQTDENGNFVIQASEHDRLHFSSIAYAAQTIRLANRAHVHVSLLPADEAIEQVVVTAQGVQRTTKALGYAAQNVDGESLTQRSETNVLNTMQGKVAGVNISSASGQPGASTNINIRGITSFGGNNQPLIVVDGIILSNDTDNSQNTLFGSQPSNRLNDIPPELIESVSILKGPAASALYGSRASAGVLMITTKSGKGLKGKTEVTLNSSLNMQQVAYLPKLQTGYGQGANNLYDNQSTNSWGPSYDSFQEVIQGGTGLMVPYQPYPNNIREFYDTGAFYQNSVNLAGGDELSNFVAGLSSTIQTGIVPFSTYNRHTANVGGNRSLNNGIQVGGTLTYAKTSQRGSTMGNGGSAFGQITRIPMSYDLNGTPIYSPTRQRQYFIPAQNSPLWSVENEFFTSEVDRVFGNIIVGYDLANWLNVSYRITGDTYFDQRSQVLRTGAARQPLGAIDEGTMFRSELNGDLMITARQEDFLIDGLNATLLLGQNLNAREFRESGIVSSSLSIFAFDNVANASVFTGSFANRYKRRLVGHYGQLSLGYQDYLFLELTGRADKSSTLPVHNNTYFYPSAAISFVPTTAWKSLQSEVISFWKIRANAARVGRDADPYLLTTLYGAQMYGNATASIQFPLSIGGLSIPGFGIHGGRIGNPDLRPEFVTSYEMGTQIGLFQNRLDLDLTYFSTRSSNQIFHVAVSNSSGFDTRTANIGLMTNKGVEAVFSGYPIRKSDFSWQVNLNFTRIRNRVVSIFGDQAVGGSQLTSTIIPGVDAYNGASPSIAEGHPYGVIVGAANARNENGDLLINPVTGLFMPVVGNQVIANPQKDYMLGIINTLTYKGLSIMALIDIQQGGQIYSFSQVDMRVGGMVAETGVARDQPRALPGVIANADGTYRANDIQISAQSYWQGLGGIYSEAAVFDATSYRLRELAINYTLPARVLRNTPFGQLSMGFSGRNLWMFAPGFPSDPEVNTQGAGNVQGMDLNGVPTTRNYGFNIRATF